MVEPVTELELLEFPARVTVSVLGDLLSIDSVIEVTETLPPFCRAIVTESFLALDGGRHGDRSGDVGEVIVPLMKLAW